MDAIALLKADHKAVSKLFREYKAAKKKDSASRAKFVDNAIKELSIHAAIEEQVFYPAVRAEVPKLEDDILESLEEHHVLKWTLEEISVDRCRRRALRRQGDGDDGAGAPPRRGRGDRLVPEGARRAARGLACRSWARRWRRRRRRRPARPSPTASLPARRRPRWTYRVSRAPRPSSGNPLPGRRKRLPQRFDERAFARISGRRSGVLDATMPALSRAADHSVLWFTVAAGLGAFGGRRGRRAALRGTLAIAGSSAIASGILKRAAPPRIDRRSTRSRSWDFAAAPPRRRCRRGTPRRRSPSPPRRRSSCPRSRCRSARSRPRSRTRACTTACTIPATSRSAARSAWAWPRPRSRCGRGPTLRPRPPDPVPPAAGAGRGRSRHPTAPASRSSSIPAARSGRGEDPTDEHPRRAAGGADRRPRRRGRAGVRVARGGRARRRDRHRRRRRLDQHGRRHRARTRLPARRRFPAEP